MLLCIAVNIAGIFTHYPSEQAQRKGFLETRGFVQTRINLQTENEEQVCQIYVFQHLYQFSKLIFATQICVMVISD